MYWSLHQGSTRSCLCCKCMGIMHDWTKSKNIHVIPPINQYIGQGLRGAKCSARWVATLWQRSALHQNNKLGWSLHYAQPKVSLCLRLWFIINHLIPALIKWRTIWFDVRIHSYVHSWRLHLGGHLHQLRLRILRYQLNRNPCELQIVRFGASASLLQNCLSNRVCACGHKELSKKGSMDAIEQ